MNGLEIERRMLALGGKIPIGERVAFFEAKRTDTVGRLVLVIEP